MLDLAGRGKEELGAVSQEVLPHYGLEMSPWQLQCMAGLSH